MSMHPDLATYSRSVAHLEQLDTTQIEFVDVTPLKARYGDRWPKVRERIWDVCEAFIRKRTDQSDVVMRAANGFLVLPGPHRVESAEVFSGRIQRELTKFFLGEEFFAGLEVTASVQPVPSAALINALASPLVGRAARAYAAVDDAPAPRPALRLNFEPVWAARTGFIALHYAAPARGCAPPVWPSGAGAPPQRQARDRLLEYDVAVFRAAAQARRVSAPNGAASAVCVPVRFETLASAMHRRAYLSEWRSLPDIERAMLLLLINGTEMSAPATLLTEVCRSARMVTRRVVMRIDPATVRVERFEQAHLDVFACNAPASALDAGRLALLRQRFARLGVLGALTHCNSREMVADAVASGFSQLCGPAIGAPTPVLAAPYTFNPLQEDPS